MNMFVLATQTDDWDHMNGWSGMWFWGVAMMALFVVLIVWLVRASTGSAGSGRSKTLDPTERAREILAERFARGELSIEEYGERVEALR